MISINTTTSDTNGSILINTVADIRDNTARISRTKTLDGGVVINNSGFSAGDMTLRISERISESKAAVLWYIFQNYTSILLSTNAGLFLAAIQSLKPNNGKMTMTILIESEEN